MLDLEILELNKAIGYIQKPHHIDISIIFKIKFIIVI